MTQWPWKGLPFHGQALVGVFTARARPSTVIGRNRPATPSPTHGGTRRRHPACAAPRTGRHKSRGRRCPGGAELVVHEMREPPVNPRRILERDSQQQIDAPHRDSDENLQKPLLAARLACLGRFRRLRRRGRCRADVPRGRHAGLMSREHTRDKRGRLFAMVHAYCAALPAFVFACLLFLAPARCDPERFLLCQMQ